MKINSFVEKNGQIKTLGQCLREACKQAKNRNENLERVLIQLDKEEIRKFFQMSFDTFCISKQGKSKYLEELLLRIDNQEIDKALRESKGTESLEQNSNKESDYAQEWSNLEQSIYKTILHEPNSFAADWCFKNPILTTELVNIEKDTLNTALKNPDLYVNQKMNFLGMVGFVEKMWLGEVDEKLRESRLDYYQEEDKKLAYQFLENKKNLVKEAPSIYRVYKRLYGEDPDLLEKTGAFIKSVLLELSFVGSDFADSVSQILVHNTEAENKRLKEMMNLRTMEEMAIKVNDGRLDISCEMYYKVSVMNLAANDKDTLTDFKYLGNEERLGVRLEDYFSDILMPILEKAVPELYKNIEYTSYEGMYFIVGFENKNTKDVEKLKKLFILSLKEYKRSDNIENNMERAETLIIDYLMKEDLEQNNKCSQKTVKKLKF